MEMLSGIRGLVVDLDGTLYIGDELIPGAVAALSVLRAADMPMRFLTNTTSKPRKEIAGKLQSFGLGIDEGTIHTAPVAAATILQERGIERACFLLQASVLEDFEGIAAVEEDVQAVVVGDMGSDWTYDKLNRAFRHLLAGADFFALAENRRYRHGDGMRLDVGAFVRALEYGSQRKAELLGKPSPDFFRAAVVGWQAAGREIVSIGDDLEGDVAGGQGAGFLGVLVRTGKYCEGDLQASSIRPDAVLDSFAELPALLGLA